MQPLNTSVFDASSPQARAIARLFYFDLAIAAVVFATVAGLVLFAAARFRHRPGSAEPYQDAGNPRLETLWTVVPALILVALFVGTARVMNEVNPPVGNRDPDAVVVAHQWWWEFRYPGSGVVTANELHLPANQKQLLEIRSADVIHDFWVPDLGAKVDAVPGHPNYLWMRPERLGHYWGTCAEFCGRQHALMGIRVIVEAPAAFATWQKEQLLTPPPPAPGTMAAQGERLFLGRTCQNCHTFAGTPATGKVGPDLTHLRDRETLAAGVLDNNLSNLTRWLVDPQIIKPGCLMPDLNLKEQEAKTIAFYLERQP